MSGKKKTPQNGWLDRQGKLYPCKFLHHARAEIATVKQLRLPATLEYLGWVKVHDAGVFFYEADSYHNRQHIRITTRQSRWLDNNV